MSALCVTNKMETRGIWRNVLKILTEFDASDRFVIITYHKDLPYTF
jgi:hypothetical protein